MNIRPAVVIFDVDSALTIVKPISSSYCEQLYVIREDAYGEIIGMLEYKLELKNKLNLSDAEFEEILLKLK